MITVTTLEHIYSIKIYFSQPTSQGKDGKTCLCDIVAAYVFYSAWRSRRTAQVWAGHIYEDVQTNMKPAPPLVVIFVH
jgi:hypothetical protein